MKDLFGNEMEEKEEKKNTGSCFTSYHAMTKTLIKEGIVPISISVGKFKAMDSLQKKYIALAPTWAMLKANYSWDDYRKLILSKLTPEQVMNDLKRISEGKPFAILCFEKNDSECHRSIAAEWLRSSGFEIKEFVK